MVAHVSYICLQTDKYKVICYNKIHTKCLFLLLRGYMVGNFILWPCISGAVKHYIYIRKYISQNENFEYMVIHILMYFLTLTH